MLNYFRKKQIFKSPITKAFGPEDFNKSVFTTRHVLVDKHVISTVVHDHDDDWQFFSDHDTDLNEAMLVSLREILDLDPTISGLAGLPKGSEARRKTNNDNWEIVKI